MEDDFPFQLGDFWVPAINFHGCVIKPNKQTTNTGNQQLIYASCSAGPLGACKPAERPLLVIRHPTKVPVVFLEPRLQQTTTNVIIEIVGFVG